jgi:hypothetical protein
MFTNEEMLARLNAALKSITVQDLGQSVLAPEQFAQFVKTMQPNTVVLDEARFSEMTRETKNIDRIGFIGQILSRGRAVNGTINIPTAVKPSTATNQLIAKEMVAITGLDDDALEVNIERDSLEQTLMDIFSLAAGRDLEMFGLLADSASDPTGVLSLSDGWAKLAGQAVYNGMDFDITDVYDPATPLASCYPENIFQACLTALPKEYLAVRNEWRLYVPFEVFDGYANLLKARNTALGDKAQTDGESIPYKGIQVTYCPMLERSATVGDGGAGRICLLEHPDNMVWGLFRNVRIEPDRVAKERKTDFVLTLKADVGYEDENAAVVAYLDQATPGT